MVRRLPRTPLTPLWTGGCHGSAQPLLMRGAWSQNPPTPASQCLLQLSLTPPKIPSRRSASGGTARCAD
eukprot:7143374-Prymnesium_polylepis.1